MGVRAYAQSMRHTEALTCVWAPCNQLARVEDYLAGQSGEAGTAEPNGDRAPSRGRQRMDKWISRLQERSKQVPAPASDAHDSAGSSDPAAVGQQVTSVADPAVESRAAGATKLARWMSRCRATPSSTPPPPATCIAAPPAEDKAVASKLHASELPAEGEATVSPASSDAAAAATAAAAGHPSASAAPGGSKAARWTARATNKSAEALTQKQMPEFSSADPASHPYVNGFWATRPVAGSAMEAWMVRAAARQLHLTWAEKRHDYCDEMLLQRSGLSMEQIRARRYHLNPPDVNRKVSVSKCGQAISVRSCILAAPDFSLSRRPPSFSVHLVVVVLVYSR